MSFCCLSKVDISGFVGRVERTTAPTTATVNKRAVSSTEKTCVENNASPKIFVLSDASPMGVFATCYPVGPPTATIKTVKIIPKIEAPKTTARGL